MEKNRVISLDCYREQKKFKEKQSNAQVEKEYLDEEERIKTLDLFMKVIARMYKESYK